MKNTNKSATCVQTDLRISVSEKAFKCLPHAVYVHVCKCVSRCVCRSRAENVFYDL